MQHAVKKKTPKFGWLWRSNHNILLPAWQIRNTLDWKNESNYPTNIFIACVSKQGMVCRNCTASSAVTAVDLWIKHGRVSDPHFHDYCSYWQQLPSLGGDAGSVCVSVFVTESFISVTPVRTQLTRTHTKVLMSESIMRLTSAKGSWAPVTSWMTSQISCHVSPCGSQP